MMPVMSPFRPTITAWELLSNAVTASIGVSSLTIGKASSIMSLTLSSTMVSILSPSLRSGQYLILTYAAHMLPSEEHRHLGYAGKAHQLGGGLHQFVGLHAHYLSGGQVASFAGLGVAAGLLAKGFEYFGDRFVATLHAPSFQFGDGGLADPTELGQLLLCDVKGLAQPFDLALRRELHVSLI